ncbi:hypothetical protein NQT66_14770 [Cellulophaga baltica]|uniref:hypothetical protein n=1 Tax=Cellulophaga baltica TaxID=76594 RepID=UPI002149146F|nr:hypothetical protein [Cellulophaga baltica]MCR1026083.1 hypothetical protein [Cellulophaga baltica]
MNNNNEEILKNLEFLVEKSRNLLQEQLKSYDSANNKAGVLISISALLIPIAVTFISSTDSLPIIKYLTLVPTGLMIIALIYLLKVLMPKGLDHGFNFEQFDNQLNSTYKDLLLFEIGANRDSYSDNTKIVVRQNKNFKTGIKFIFSSAIIIFIIVTVSLFVPKTELKDKEKKEIVIEQLDINKLNIKSMSDNNSNNDSGSNSGQNQQSQQSTQETTSIPNVPREQRANLEKGEESKPLTKK